VDAKHASDADGVESAFVDQASNGLRMDTEPAGDLADAVEAVRLGIDGRHDELRKLYTPRTVAP